MALSLSPFAPRKSVLSRSERRQSGSPRPEISAIELTPSGSPKRLTTARARINKRPGVRRAADGHKHSAGRPPVGYLSEA